MVGSKVSENTNAYTSTKNFLPELTIVKNHMISKVECILPCTFDQALLSYFDNNQLYKSDPNCGKFETTEYHKYEDLLEISKKQQNEEELQKYKRDCAVNRIEMKMPFPFNPRVANYAVTGYYDPKNMRFMRVGKNFLREGNWCCQSSQEVTLKRDQQPKMKKVYNFLIFSGAMHTKLDNHKVLYQEINIIDLAGWASSKLMFNLIIQDRKNKIRNQMMKMVSEFPEDVKITNLKEKLTSLIDGKPNGLGTLLSRTIEINSSEEENKEENVKSEGVINKI